MIPGVERSSGEENGNPLQYSHLGNPMNRGAWQATVHGVAKVSHNLEIKPPPPPSKILKHTYDLLLGKRVNAEVAVRRL